MADTNIVLFSQVVSYLTLYVPYLTIIIGTIGAFCNFLTFTSKELRNNTCAVYLLYSAIFDLIYIWTGTLTRLMSVHYVYLIPSRFRSYKTIVVPVIAIYFILLASIDRCLLTSITRKQLFTKIRFAH